TLWVDGVLRGMRPDEPHRASNVLDDLRDGELWLGTMHDNEDRLATLQEFTALGLARLRPGLPAATRQGENAYAGRAFRFDDVHRERHAELSAVNDVGNGDCLHQRPFPRLLEQRIRPPPRRFGSGNRCNRDFSVTAWPRRVWRTRSCMVIWF